MFEGPFTESIIKRAIQNGIVDIHLHNLRDYSNDKHKRVDDYAFSAGAGMVMMIEPIDNCISYLKKEREYDDVIYMSPDGEIFTQSLANRLSLYESVIMLCGHYKGIDERIREHLVTREILSDSFQDGLVSPPVYTRPREYKGWTVPEVLLSGNDMIINEWKLNQAIERTKARRPEMYEILKKK